MGPAGDELSVPQVTVVASAKTGVTYVVTCGWIKDILEVGFSDKVGDEVGIGDKAVRRVKVKCLLFFDLQLII